MKPLFSLILCISLVRLQPLPAQIQEKPEVILNAPGSRGGNVIALSTDDRLLAVGYFDGLIKIRNSKDQSLIRAVKVDGRVEKMRFSPHSDSLLVETQKEDKSVWLYLFDWSKEQYPSGQPLGKYRFCAWTAQKQAIYLIREDETGAAYSYSYRIERRDYHLKYIGKPLSLVVKHSLKEGGEVIQDKMESCIQANDKPLLAMGFQAGWLAIADLDSMRIVWKRRVAKEEINGLNFSLHDRYLCADIRADFLSSERPTAMVWLVEDDFKPVYQGQPFGAKGTIYRLFAFEDSGLLNVEGQDSLLSSKTQNLIIDLRSGQIKTRTQQFWGERRTSSNEKIQYSINGAVSPADTFEFVAYGSESRGLSLQSAFHPFRKSVFLGCLANEWSLDTLPTLKEYPKNAPVQLFGSDGQWICEKADAFKLSFIHPDLSSFKTGKPTLNKATLCFKWLDPSGHHVLRYDSLVVEKVSQNEISTEDAVTLSPNLRGLVSKISDTQWVYFEMIPPKDPQKSNWALRERKTFTFSNQKVLDIRFSPKGEYLVVTTFPEEAKDWSLPLIEVFNTVTLKKVQSFGSAFLDPNDRPFGDASAITAISPDLVYCSAAKTVEGLEKGQHARFFDLKTGKQIDDFNTYGAIKAVAAHPSQPIFAIGSTGAKGCKVVLYNIEQHQFLDTLLMDIYSSDIISIDFCRWAPLLLVSSSDYVELWNWETGQRMVTLFADGNRNDAYAGTVLFTPEGYYATYGLINDNLIRYRFGQKTYPLQSLDADYNRPDYVLQKIGVASPMQINQYRAAREKRMKKLQGSQNNPQYATPVLRVLGEEHLPPFTLSSSITLSVSMRDDSIPLQALKVWVNNVPLQGRKGYALAGTGILHEMNIEIPLDTGRNLIELAVTNQQGNMSERTRVNIHGAFSLPPDFYVVLIGESHYLHSDSLPGPEKDVEYLSQIFKQQSKGMDSKGLHVFNKLKVKAFTNQNVNIHTMTEAQAFCAQARPQDIVLVYYAGHGLADKSGGYYLATYDMDFLLPSEKGIALDSLMAWLEDIPSRKKVLAINACNSGEFDQDQAVFEAMRNIFPFFQPSKGTHVIASSSAQQFSFAAGGNKHRGLTPFGYALADFFKYEPQNLFSSDEISRQAKSVYGSTHLVVSDLANYIRKKVIKITDGAQVPEYRQSNFRSDFVLWSTYFDGM